MEDYITFSNKQYRALPTDQISLKEDENYTVAEKGNGEFHIDFKGNTS